MFYKKFCNCQRPNPGTVKEASSPNPHNSPHNLVRICAKMKSTSHVQLFVTPWTVAYQAPLSMGFSRQEYWSGVPLEKTTHLPFLFYCSSTAFLSVSRARELLIPLANLLSGNGSNNRG